MTEATVPVLVRTIADLRQRLDRARAGSEETGRSGRIVLVPTMGALHEGHIALVRRAVEAGDVVVVSIFVNPLQFGHGEDLDTYPRTLEADLAKLAPLGVAFVFAPSTREMYPEGTVETRVTAGHVGTLFEGASRPGHFDGMLTVVSKLFNIVGPGTAVFGQKDAQQAFLVQRMVADLNVPVAIDVVPTVRESSGLALSSRNRNLDDAELQCAHALSAGLEAAASVAGDGVEGAVAAARAVIEAQPLVKLDYLVVVDPETFLPVGADYRGPGRMLVAAVVGSTRLIDNAPLTLT